MATILNTDFYIPSGSSFYDNEDLLDIIAKRCISARNLPYQYLLYDTIYIPISDFHELIPILFQFGSGVINLFESGQIKLLRQESNFALFKQGVMNDEESIEQLQRYNGLMGTIMDSGERPTTHLDSETVYDLLVNSEYINSGWRQILRSNKKLILENTLTVDLTDNLEDISDTSKKDVVNYFNHSGRETYLDSTPDKFWNSLSTMMNENNIDYLFPMELGTGNPALALANVYMAQVIFNTQVALMKRFGIDDIAESEEVKYSLRFGRLLNDVDYYSWILSSGPAIKSKKNNFLLFQEMTKLPNISQALEGNKNLIVSLIKLKESGNGRSFRDWFHANCGADNKQLTQAYIELLSSESKFEKKGTKILRFLTTTGVGMIPVIGQIAGTALGAIDTFLLDRLDSSKRPKMFIEKVKGAMP